MRAAAVAALLGLALLLCSRAAEAKVLMVQTLTRHGTRAPDKIVGEKLCRPIVNGEDGVHKAFVKVFGTGASELTQVGVRQMRDVGAFLRERYHGFLWADYSSHSKEWQFISKEGARQQRSMMGIIQGIFPDDAVPISVTRRETDTLLGGPAPQCGDITHDYIVEWHRTKGKEMVKHRQNVIRPFERVCNISLIDDPVNNVPGNANPHAYIGDISDLMDSLFEVKREPLPISVAEHASLTQLAHDLETGARFDYPGGAALHVGEFADYLLKSFEQIEANDGKRPNSIPKMRMHTCSRQLHYGLSHLFKWEDIIRLPNQPIGRIRAGTTFIWELHSDMKIRTYYYQYPQNAVELEPPMTISEYRQKYNDAIAKCGDWKQICVTRENKCLGGSLLVPPEPPVTAQQPALKATKTKAHNSTVPARLEKNPTWSLGIIVLFIILSSGVVYFIRQRYTGYSPI